MDFALKSSGGATKRRRKRRDPQPHFQRDRSEQLDALVGCPELQVPAGHLARRVRAVVERLDVSVLEARYSSLGRPGYAPRAVLGVWIYASLIGQHTATRVEASCRTDAAFRLLSQGYSLSASTLRRFRRDNGEFFADAIEQTIRLAHEEGLVDVSDLSVDSVRIRADASTKAVRTVKRSTERLEQLSGVDVTALGPAARQRHEEKVAKHRHALATCAERGTQSVVVTAPSAVLMKFPNGGSGPGHRVTVTAAGMSARLVVSVLVEPATNDYGKLGPAVASAREALRNAGVDLEGMSIAADAGYASDADLTYAYECRDEVDVLVADPPSSCREQQFSRHDFRVDEDLAATCPAGMPMDGPTRFTDGRLRWTGTGCGQCALRPRCTKGAAPRALTSTVVREAMRERLEREGAAERYQRRMATIEPVFASIQHSMGYRRASSRHPFTVDAEIRLKLLAHNVARLAASLRSAVILLLELKDGRQAIQVGGNLFWLGL